jgi:Domain of unknown function (DUF5666)
MKRALLVSSLIVLFAALAFAHGGDKHIMGTVTKVSKTSVTVQTVKNETREITINEKTTFQKDGAPAKADDLKVGDRVVIHAGKSGDKLTAHSVRIGADKATATHASSR